MKVILVAAGKGGTGKTTTTALLGKVLSKNHKVALLDLDVCGPTLPAMAGLDNADTLECDDKYFYPKKINENLEIFSPAFMFPPDIAVAWGGDKRKELIHELIDRVKWDSPEYLICDAPPGSSDEILAVLQYIPKVDGALIVTIPKREGIDDARRLLTLLKNRLYNTPILGIVENMGNVLAGDESFNLFADGSNVEAELGEKVIARIPWKADLDVDDFAPVAEIIEDKLREAV